MHNNKYSDHHMLDVSNDISKVRDIKEHNLAVTKSSRPASGVSGEFSLAGVYLCSCPSRN